MALNKHSAAGQALGYVYQVGWGLLELVRAGPEDHELRLETVDDVSWHDAVGGALQALQIKHHQGGGATITDVSPDVWRTVSVWLDDTVLAAPGGPGLVLVTTQDVREGSALALLGPSGRSPEEARQLLDKAAADSKSNGTRVARERWLELPEAHRSEICNRVTIVWQQGTAEHLASQIKKAAFLALPPGQEDSFVRMLLGWWWDVAVDMLRGSRRGVCRVDVHLHLDYLREQFSSRSLPITVGYEMVPTTSDGSRDRTFAKQLAWVSAGEQLLLFAVRDYYRAYAQAQDWVDNHLVELAELMEYERRLVEEWMMHYEFMRVNLGESATDEKMCAAGMQLFQRAMEQSPALLRPSLTDPFYSRGTHHRLADDSQVGWHPEFRDRLEQLLGGDVT